MLKKVDVAISRTRPAHADRRGVHEIEALYLTIIAATRRSLYIESQYFASRTLAEAMAARLSEPDGPEIVIINPESARGWLEEKSMGSARAKLLRVVRRADIHGRFRIYTPVARGGTPIYVHAKIVIMDDTLMRVGSSNLNNRSMGFDTECDLSIEAAPNTPGDAETRTQIAGLRTGLVAEHLDVEARTVERAIKTAGGSLIAAIEALRGGGRSLVPFVPPDIGAVEDNVLRENDMMDPERPSRWWHSFSGSG